MDGPHKHSAEPKKLDTRAGVSCDSPRAMPRRGGPGGLQTSAGAVGTAGHRPGGWDPSGFAATVAPFVLWENHGLVPPGGWACCGDTLLQRHGTRPHPTTPLPARRGHTRHGAPRDSRPPSHRFPSRLWEPPSESLPRLQGHGPLPACHTNHTRNGRSPSCGLPCSPPPPCPGSPAAEGGAGRNGAHMGDAGCYPTHVP